jgi:hypothetical protein
MRAALIGRSDNAPKTETFQLKDLKPKVPPANPQLQELAPRTAPLPGAVTGQVQPVAGGVGNASTTVP